MRKIFQFGTYNRSLALVAMLAGAAAVSLSCATTSAYDDYGPAPMPAGKGRLTLQAGGIPRLNFYVIDTATEKVVHADTPLQGAFSPSAFQSGLVESNLSVDLDPGVYRVVVNTHIEENVEPPEVEVRMGEETPVMIRVGRFQLIMAGGPTRLPFMIMDYNMSNVLGRGMTTPDVRHFIVPEGHYKIRLENFSSGIDTQRPLEVSFGRITPIQIGTSTTTEEPDEAADQ